MRAIIAILLIVAGISNAAYLGIPMISRTSAMTVRAASWDWLHPAGTGDKLSAGGAAIMWGTAVTSLAVLPWLKETQRQKWYVPMACACLGGAALCIAGKVAFKH